MRTIVLSLALTAGLAGTVHAQEKKRVAILDFDNAGVPQGGGTAFFTFSSAPNVGKSAADLLLLRLVQNGVVSVIERAAIDKVLSEQNFSNSNRVDAQTAAQIGRILGVDGIVLGSVARYIYEDKVTGGGGGGPLGGFRGGSMSTKHDFKAQVQISARVVSPNTAEVVSVSLGSGEVIKKGVKVDMRDQNAALAMMTGNVNNPIMSEAIDKALVQLTPLLEQSFTKLPARAVQISGLVADAQDTGRLVINVGSANGVKVGDRLQIWREGKEIRDPSTGKVLLRDDTLLGEAVVNSVSEAFSMAAFEGTGKVQRGDAVKSDPKKP